MVFRWLGRESVRMGSSPQGWVGLSPGVVAAVALATLFASGCAHRPPTPVIPLPPPVGGDRSCEAEVAEGVALAKAGEKVAAAEHWRVAYGRCGPGYGLLSLQAIEAGDRGDLNRAADLLLREMSEPGPDPRAIRVLLHILPDLSAEARASVEAAGQQLGRPVTVSVISDEYVWMSQVLCRDKGRLPIQQSLLPGDHGMIDRLTVTCPDGLSRTVYFDPSADPKERQMMEEVQRRAAGDRG